MEFTQIKFMTQVDPCRCRPWELRWGMRYVLGECLQCFNGMCLCRWLEVFSGTITTLDRCESAILIRDRHRFTPWPSTLLLTWVRCEISCCFQLVQLVMYCYIHGVASQVLSNYKFWPFTGFDSIYMYWENWVILMCHDWCLYHNLVIYESHNLVMTCILRLWRKCRSILQIQRRST